MQDINNIWAEMMNEPKPHRVVPFPRCKPGTDEPYCDVSIVMLTAEESALITRDAELKTRRMLKEQGQVADTSAGYADLFQRFCAEGILFTAVNLAEDPRKRFFPRKEDIFKVLTVDEVGALLNLYYTVQLDLGPVIGELNDESAEQWLRKLTDGGTQARFFLSSFSVAALTDLVMYLARRLEASQTVSSSPTPPQEGSSDE